MCYETTLFVFYTSKDDVYYPKSSLPRELFLIHLTITNLIDMSKTVSTGESKQWKGSITVKEYEHILTADGRILNHTEWVNAGMPEKLDDSEFEYMIYPKLMYKEADITKLDRIQYHIIEPRGSGSCSGSDRLLNRFRIAGYTGYGGSHRFNEDDVFVMTVRWNGNEEVV